MFDKVDDNACHNGQACEPTRCRRLCRELRRLFRSQLTAFDYARDKVCDKGRASVSRLVVVNFVGR